MKILYLYEDGWKAFKYDNLSDIQAEFRQNEERQYGAQWARKELLKRIK